MNPVEVTTGARLHFGLICAPVGTPFLFGGVGLMLQQPAWRLHVSRADSFSCQADSSEVQQRLQALLPRFGQLRGLSGLHVEVRNELPLHRGLGAGTQLSLALATAAGLLAGHRLPDSSLLLAEQLDRARRSAVGSYGFDRGGLIIDHGHPPGGRDRQLNRLQLPEDWRVVLLLPAGPPGLSGPKEEASFQAERLMSDELIREQSTLMTDDITAAVETQDFDRFVASLGRYGTNAGRFFAAEQGGVYSSEVFRRWANAGLFGDLNPVQSSWGPTVAIFAPSSTAAENIVQQVESFGSDKVYCLVTEVRKTGATARSLAPEPHNATPRLC